MSTIPFHRPARVYPEAPKREPVSIVLPPVLQPPAGKLASWLQALSPLLVGMSSMAFFFIIPPPFKYIMPFVALASIVSTMALRWAQNRQAKKQKLHFRARYLSYLEDREVTLRERASLQLSAVEHLLPDPEGLWHIALDRGRLWERRRFHPDFLRLRIGRGRLPLVSAAEMGAPDPLAEYEPDLMEAANAVVRRYTTINDAPVEADLTGLGSIAVTGDLTRARGLVRALLCSAAVLHAADDVVIAAAYPPQLRDQWAWLKWLPHNRDRSPGAVANGSGPPCLLADSAQSLATILSHVTTPRLELLQRAGRAIEEATAPLSHIILVVDGYQPRGDIGRLASLRDIMSLGRVAKVTVISIIESRQDEPSTVDARIDLDVDGSLRLAETAPGGYRVRVLAESAATPVCEAVARCLAPLRLEERQEGGGRELAETVKLLDLLGLQTPSAVDPRESWQQRSRQDVLRVPIGIRGDGEPLVLDLKESAVGGMGPHGLVIGATGSGKSELLRTLVTGLAVSHSPELLGFVFVDFKGGAAFADLADLPHVAGMITNLQNDLSRIDRMHAALVGEQERRQRLLREGGNLDGIKEYHVRRLQRPELSPMPYLLIVVDEFGELLAARPDFLDLFIAIGRVGRSLGMHLLFATQRLDEGRIRGLEGHLRYRICLRTFSAQESQAVLGTPDAYNLPPFPGAGYFKVDTTTYSRFKTALISSPYQEGRNAHSERAPIALFAGITHSAMSRPGDDEESTRGSGLPTEMEAAIDRLNSLGRDLMPAIHQVWLPPLADYIPLDDVLRRTGFSPQTPRPLGPLRVPVGMLDLPTQQAQEPFVLDFSATAGHMMLAGAPQTGKSTFLRTLISSFALTHSPEEVQFYCIDLGGGGLHGLAGLPHVGSVAGKLDKDRLSRIVRQMHSVIEEREILFRKHAIDTMATFRRRRASGDLPASMLGDVFLVIDNWSAFKQEFEDADADVQPLLATGLGFGVHVIIASSRWADIRTNLKDNIGGRYELRLNDPMDSDMPRGAAKTLPVGVAGRGLTPQVLQFQAALPRIDGTEGVSDLTEGVDQLVAAVRNRWSSSQNAPPVKLLPPVLRLEDLPTPGSAGPPGVPVGVEEFRLEPVYLDVFSTEPHFLLLGDSECGKTNFLRAWMHQISLRHSSEEVRFVLIDYRRTLLDMATSDHVVKYAATGPQAKDAVEAVRLTLTERLPPAELTRDELINRSWWSGPEVILIVDDYDLVVTPAGNPVQPLVELLAQGRDLGFHLVLSRRVGGMARSAFEAVLQRVKELGTPSLIMSGDPGEGPIVGTQKAQLQPPGRGYLVRRGQRTALVQTVRVDATD
ncbi:MAG: type VII secretion protein EccCb [Candidatus Dormibacteria bacterium]